MRDLQPRLIARAAEILGSDDRLAARLRVELHALVLWRKGKATAPDWVLHSIVDLILKDDIARAAQDRRGQPREDLVPLNVRV